MELAVLVHALATRHHHDVAAQLEFESEVRRRFIILWFQALSSRRVQRGFDRVNLHRPTMTPPPVTPPVTAKRAGMAASAAGSSITMAPAM